MIEGAARHLRREEESREDDGGVQVSQGVHLGEGEREARDEQVQ